MKYDSIHENTWGCDNIDLTKCKDVTILNRPFWGHDGPMLQLDDDHMFRWFEVVETHASDYFKVGDIVFIRGDLYQARFV
jgi:hypothetical protein